MTVAQLEQSLGADRAAHKPDLEIARRISDVDLSERLTDVALGRLNQQFQSGSAAAAALLLLADRSAFLDPPASELPDTQAPDATAQRRLLAAVQKFAIETLPRLPNLIATRSTFSFDDSPEELAKGGYPQRMGMHLIGTSKTEVYVRNETQNQSTGAGRESSRASGGLSTWGEFGSTLLIILSDSEHGKTEWSHWEQTSSGRMAVFHYEVPRNASHYEIVTPVQELQSSGQSTRWAGSRAADMGPVSVSTRFVRKKPAYQGSLWIDADTGTITRVTLVADLRGNPTFERGAILVDYGPVQIADKTLICPVRSLALSSAPSTVNTTFSGVATEWLNENLFTDYHLFGSTARILGNQVAETAPPQPSPESAPGAASAAIAEPATESQASPSLLTPTQAAPLPAS